MDHPTISVSDFGLATRIRNIVLAPKSEWRVIQAEPTPVGRLYSGYVMPMAAFAMLLLEESRLYGFELARDSLPTFVGLLVLLEVIAPIVTQRALIAAGEAKPEGS